MIPNKTYLTKGEQKILDYWKEYERAHGNPPTIYQAMKDFGFSGHGYIHGCVKKLTELGYMQAKQIKGRMGNTYSVVGRQDGMMNDGQNLKRGKS